jgi:hypothetical protein
VKLRYTLRAAAELDEVLAYIEARSPQGARRVCFSTELGPHREGKQRTEIEHEYTQAAGSRSAPTGTPLILKFLVLNQCAIPGSMGGPSSVLTHTLRLD